MTIDRARRLVVVARWHRRVALAVCLWLLVLAGSGLLINHAHGWGLDRSSLAFSLQRLFYGIERDGEGLCTEAAIPGPDCAGVFARLSLASGELLLGGDALFLIDEHGVLLERLAAANFGLSGFEAGLLDGQDVYLRDTRQVVRTDPELLDWQALDSAAAEALAGGEWQVRVEGGVSISWERFLLDLHAARFLGPLASVFTDLMAILALLLALSGIWFWWLKRSPGRSGPAGPQTAPADHSERA